MPPLNYALAAVLLTSPADSGPPPAELVTCRPAVRDLCLDWELMDPRECRYTLASADPDYFDHDALPI